ncbi:MAG: [protein-PII] uridylyltransferase [Puniceicoccales bacterium]|jgi:[protein-PII] uridylyltransferase|nr:[protein-PII] uridylyltransferase [Puniceicoccales bacterium]
MPFPSHQSLLNRVREHARRRGIFGTDHKPGEWLLAARHFIKIERLDLLRKHRQGMAGIEVARRRATILEVLLGCLLQNTLSDLSQEEREAISLVALGGFGRGELCPHSDIDLMFLYDDSRLVPGTFKALQERVTNGVLYPLWDLRYKVGYSTRTVSESVHEARGDAITRNSLLDARYLAGAELLFGALVRATDAAIREDGIAGQVRFLLAEQARRHARYGGSVFMQEPDIKNGVGGLRDFQTLGWLARLLGEGDGLGGLVRRGFLRPAEAKAATDAYSFLMRVRNELHFQSERATEVLSLEKQASVAEKLQGGGENWMHQIESLMRDYYLAADTVRQTACAVGWHFEANPEATQPPTPRRVAREKLEAGQATSFDGFVMQRGSLSAEAPNVFDEDPVRLLRVFRHVQQYRAMPDFPLLRLVREKIPLLTPRVARSRQAVDCFMSILADAGHVGDALTQMHEVGVLCRFIPEFSGIHCLVQREIYHRYTVDVHTLRCLRELDAVFADAGPVTARYRTALLETEEPALLYLVLLFHDIGKQFGVAEHARTGAELAGKILLRLGVAARARTEITDLIRAHLDMSAFWQKHDLDEPANIALFAERVATAQRLRYLYVLTYCDARATAQELWNDYKNTLHRQLYLGALARLEPAEACPPERARDVLRHEMLVAHSRETISEAEIEGHLALLPGRYFQQYGAQDALLHIRMIEQLRCTITSSLGESRASVVHWTRGDVQEVFTVTIVAWDCEGLFHLLAGAFAVSGLGILSARANVRADQVVMDTFQVTAPGVATNEELAALRGNFSRNVDEILVQRRSPEQDIRRLLTASCKKDRLPYAPAVPRVKAYFEPALSCVVAEIKAEDRIGLLFFLSRVFFRHRMNILFARVTTERGMARDTFYLEHRAFNGASADLKSLHGDLVAEIQRN